MLKTHVAPAGSGETDYLNANKDPELETICRKVSTVAFKLTPKEFKLMKEPSQTTTASVLIPPTPPPPPRLQSEPRVPSSPKCSHVWSAPLTLRVT